MKAENLKEIEKIHINIEQLIKSLDRIQEEEQDYSDEKAALVANLEEAVIHLDRAEKLIYKSIIL